MKEGGTLQQRRRVRQILLEYLCGVQAINADPGRRGGDLSVKPATSCLQSDTRNGKCMTISLSDALGMRQE